MNDRIYAVGGRHFDTGDEFLRLLNGAEGPTELEVGHEGEIRTIKLAVPDKRPPAGTDGKPGK